MKTLIIDSFSNSLGIAKAILDSSSYNGKVVVVSNCACKTLWEKYGITIRNLPGSIDEIVSLVRKENPSRVLLFNSGLASLGLHEKLKDLGLLVFGCTGNFAQTEYDRLAFKKLLSSHKVATPDVIFSGSISETLRFAEKLDVTYVLKSSESSGVSPKIIRSIDDLKAFLDSIKHVPRQKLESCTWFLEDYIQPYDTFAATYIFGGNSARVLASSRVLFCQKSLSNSTGTLAAMFPHPANSLYARYADLVAHKICQNMGAGIGIYQAHIDNSGKFWVIENNARPAVGALYCRYFDFNSLIEAALSENLRGLSQRDIYKDEYLCGDNTYGKIKTIVSKCNARTLKNLIDEDLCKIIPFSFNENQHGQLEKNSYYPPSIYVGNGENWSEAKESLLNLVCMHEKEEGSLIQNLLDGDELFQYNNRI